MLSAYFDESEMSEGGQRVFTVGGCLASSQDWAAFAPAWKSVLDRFGLSSFHTTDYEARRGSYANLSNEERTDLIVALTDVINRTQVIGIAASLVMIDFEDLSDPERGFIGEPYVHCGAWAMFCVSNFLNLNHLQGHVAFVFEGAGKGRKGWGKLCKLFWEARNRDRQRLRLASLAQGGKETVLQLQAADLWAFEANKEALKAIGAHDRDTRKSLDAMLGALGDKARGYLFDKESMRNAIIANQRPLHFPN